MFHKKNNVRLSKYSVLEFLETLPALFAVAIVPMIVFLKVTPVEEASFVWKSSNDYDFFSYYKSISLIILGTLALFILIGKMIQRKTQLKKTKLYLPLFVYFLFILLSAIFSDYQKIAWMGFYNRYEGALSIISSVILFVYTMNVINSRKKIKIVMMAFILSSTVIITIGIFQFFGTDLFRTEFGTKLILPKAYESQSMHLSLQVEESMVFSTFKHPNYYGSYMAIVLPFVGCLLILSKQTKQRLLFGILFAAASFTLMGSRSRGGLVGVAIAFIFLFIVLRKTIFRKWKFILSIFLIGLLVLFVADYFTDGKIIGKLKSITSDPRINTNRLQLEDIVLEDSSLKIISSDAYLELKNVGNFGLAFMDENGEYLFYSVDQNRKIIFQKEEYANFSLQFATHEKGPGLIFKYGNLTANFLITESSFKFIDPRNNPIDLKKIPSFGFKGKELWGSSRGYIWSRTFPMILDTLFIGHGPDTYAIYFPQQDYVGKLISYGITNIIVDKAHNMYLQTAVNTGLVSLMALVVFLCMYIVSSIRLYEKSPPIDMISAIGVAVLCSVIGYLITGIFNDSVVSVSAVFWVLLGVGVSINLRIYKKIQGEH